jgi:hypothetical protein
MTSRRRVLTGLVLAWLAAGAAPPRQDSATAGPLRLGMTPTEVRQILGPPNRVARQILYDRYLEQWVYVAPRSLRVEFGYPRGQPASLLTVSSDDDRRP